MTLTLRTRIVLTLAPLLALTAVLGAAGVALLLQLGGSIDAILRENYDSVVAMQRLNEALDRIDSSFHFALVGRDPQEVRKQFDDNWKLYDEALRKEKDNVTIHPREDALVAQLVEETDRYRAQGEAFHRRSPPDGQDYFGPSGLHATFTEIKET